MANEQIESGSSNIPEAVVEYLTSFHQHFLDNNVDELHVYYKGKFFHLSNKYYRNNLWPHPINDVAPLVNDDQAFIVLYSELYYRHIYSKLEPTLEHRISSYSNYCNLFNLILNHEGGPVTFELPNSWLWDIIDELIYQFNQFSIYRTRLISRAASPTIQLSEKEQSEISFLRENDVWSAYSILNALYSLIGRSKIYEQLTLEKNGDYAGAKQAAGEYGSLSLYKHLGYYSIIGLLRIHTLLGDFVVALQTVEYIELGKKTIPKVIGAHLIQYYYIAVCYILLHRYTDAINSLFEILVYIRRLKAIREANHSSNSSTPFDFYAKKIEQMYALLALCIALCPSSSSSLDDLLKSALKEKHGEQLQKFSKNGDPVTKVKSVEELYWFGFPRFVNISTPRLDTPELSADCSQLHLKIFMSTVKNSLFNDESLRSYLNLYSSMELTKLQNFLNIEKKEEAKKIELAKLKEDTLAFKLSNTQICLTEASKNTSNSDLVDDDFTNSMLNGEPMNTHSDFDIILNNEIIEIVELKQARNFSQWFIRNCQKNMGLQRNIIGGPDYQKYSGNKRFDRRAGKK